MPLPEGLRVDGGAPGPNGCGAFGFDHVTVVRDGAVVLDDVSLDIPYAGITALIGTSGSGKSTMLRCCNRLEEPTSGRMRFLGTDLSSLDPLAHRRRVAMVFQQPTVFAGTVLDNLRAGASALGPSEAGTLLALVGLPAAMLTRVADTLSGGEAQRLCLARSLAVRPGVILADEPTSALDEVSTAVLEGLIRSLADTGIPVVWVTHDLAQMRRLADHVVALDRGRVRYAGPCAAYPGGAQAHAGNSRSASAVAVPAGGEADDHG